MTRFAREWRPRLRECCERVAFPEPVGAAWQQTCLGRPPLPIPQYPVVAVCQSDLSLFAALRTSRAVRRSTPSVASEMGASRSSSSLEGSFCLLLPLFLPVLSAHYFLVSLSLRGDCCFVPLQRPFLCDSKCGTACPIADEFKQPERREGAQPRCDLRHSRHARVVLVVG